MFSTSFWTCFLAQTRVPAEIRCIIFFNGEKKRKLTELISCRVIYFVCLISKCVLLTFQKASTIIIAILRIFPHSFFKKTLSRRFALIWNFLLLFFKFRIKNHFSMMIWLIKKPTPFIKGIEKAWHYETTTFYFISMMVFPHFYILTIKNVIIDVQLIKKVVKKL